jgi:anhydro-N-acetylmuramic acid kinase
MSGTSLDGLDMAVCEFSQITGGYEYRIEAAETLPYSDIQRSKLKHCAHSSAADHAKLNQRFGKFIGESVASFLSKNKLQADAVSSHGHTIFHQPENGFTNQIGCGATIAAITGLTTVCDLRSLDVALNGQGAPLVPIGDKLLFGKYDACLNLGGIANISFDNKNNERIAFDICVCNMVLNHLSNRKGTPYDLNGEWAKAGKVDEHLLKALDALDHYKIKGSRSLGYEWFETNFLKLIIERQSAHTEDLLATFTEHAAKQIALVINNNGVRSVLVTGGGAFNKHLIELIKQKTTADIILPDEKIINFKEALIFAFLGYLRLKEHTNTLHTVTGAKQDSIGGAVYLMKAKS